MASLAASMMKVAATTAPTASQQVSVARFEGLKAFPVSRRSVVAFRPSRSSCNRLRISCAADPETLLKVKGIICKQLAVTESEVSPESKFAELGADSLDTVEIMMALEENFGITLEGEGPEKIATVQEAADLIHQMCKSKAEVK